MICKVCGKQMVRDDFDFKFLGCYDIYWICPDENCQTSCIQEVRYSQSFKEIWHSEHEDKVKDWTIKHNIVKD